MSGPDFTAELNRVAKALRDIAGAIDSISEKLNTPATSKPLDTAGAWVGVKDMARLCGLSVSRIRQLSMLPNCPKVKTGRTVCYDPEVFRTWLVEGGPAKGKEEVAAKLRAKHG